MRAESAPWVLGEPDPRQLLGLAGEEAAVRVLEAAGLVILERRHRTARGEIDVIAESGGVVVFVEVKTRRAGAVATPAQGVTEAKRRRLARLAAAYLARRRWSSRPCRFDVVEVVADRGELRARHLPDAFRLWPGG